MEKQHISWTVLQLHNIKWKYKYIMNIAAVQDYVQLLPPCSFWIFQFI